MKKIVIAAFLALALAGCTDEGKELYETGQFEEQQFNKKHAAELYRQILEKHPDSDYAERAKERLAEMEKK